MSVERAFREAYGQAVATLVRVFGDISLAEDAVQDAFVVAADRWPVAGVPPNPAGWIVTTARRRAIDQLRRSQRGRELEARAPMVEPADAPQEPEIMEDDQLRLIFTCCHPALRMEHRVALTLRLLGGLTVEEIARSFLVAETAMAKRLVRAKHKIKAAGIPYRVPRAADLPDRLRGVLAVLYLIYNTGADNPARSDLRRDAVRLTRSLDHLMPDEPEVAGLLALLLLNEARMPARFVGDEIVRLVDQDRSSWDADLVTEGQQIVRGCLRRNQPGMYQIQAAIQAVHCSAPDADETDWVQIVALYDQLFPILPTPVVAMNRAIAIAEVDGPAAALDLVGELSGQLDGYHLFHATRGTLLRRIGDEAAAIEAFLRAAELAATETERRFLEEQAVVPR